jgi:hypothetical protein
MRARSFTVRLCFSNPTAVLAQALPNEDIAQAHFLEGRATYERGESARASVDWQPNTGHTINAMRRAP